MGWIADESHGSEGEVMAISYLEWDRCRRAPKRLFKDWDFWIEKDGQRSFWEVKRDRRTHETGNVVIEFESSGRPSGIAVTKADFWMYIVDDEPTIFIIPVDELKALIAAEQYSCTRYVGDYGKNRAYFFRREVLADYEYSVGEAAKV